MQKNSLLAVSIANRLNEKHAANETRSMCWAASKKHNDVLYIGRHCSIGGKRSGGYVLSARLLTKFKHDPTTQEITRRLKPGWTRKQQQKAIHSMIREVEELKTIKRKRELVYSLAESRDIDPDALEKNANGKHPVVYSDMNLADCLYWEIEIQKYPLKTQ